MFIMCEENYSTTFCKFLEMHERKREWIRSLSEVDKARIRMSRINSTKVEIEDPDITVVEEAIDAVAICEQEAETVNFFNYRTLISIFVRKFGFFERKNE